MSGTALCHFLFQTVNRLGNGISHDIKGFRQLADLILTIIRQTHIMLARLEPSHGSGDTGNLLGQNFSQPDRQQNHQDDQHQGGDRQ